MELPSMVALQTTTVRSTSCPEPKESGAKLFSIASPAEPMGFIRKPGLLCLMDGYTAPQTLGATIRALCIKTVHLDSHLEECWKINRILRFRESRTSMDVTSR